VENLKCLMALRSYVQPTEPVRANGDGGRTDEHPAASRLRSASHIDLMGVARGAAFTVAAGAIAAALMATVGETTGMARRFTLLALLALPSAVFVFATLEQDSTVQLAGALDPTPGVVEAWALTVLTAAGGTVAYGPVLGVGSSIVNASLVLLTLFFYLVGPPWLACRLTDGPSADDIAMVTVVLSMLSVVGGAALVGVGATGVPGSVLTLGAVGVLGVIAVAYSAAAPGAGTDDVDEITDTVHHEGAGAHQDTDETDPEIDAAAARRSNRPR
jgi:hypothetical protein